MIPSHGFGGWEGMALREIKLPGCKNVSVIWLEIGRTNNVYGAVYRVNLLCAKSCFDRWEEEMKTVSHEMRWCVLYFRHQKKLWLARAEKCRSREGHYAYAQKQVKMWEAFEMEALLRFRNKMIPK
jgi:hypothetical protein